MPFPIEISGKTFSSAPTLAAAVIDDARAGGGTIVPGATPSKWICDLHRRGQLEEPLVVALAAGLLRSREASAVAEGARIAASVRSPKLAALFPAALDGQDQGVLLHTDPWVPGQSIEDTLLRAWAALAPLADPQVRALLLDRVRNAGLSVLEVRILASHGSYSEIRQGLPAVWAEGMPAGTGAALAPAFVRGGDAARAVLEVLDTIPVEQRRGIGSELLEALPALAQVPGARTRLVGPQRPEA